MSLWVAAGRAARGGGHLCEMIRHDTSPPADDAVSSAINRRSSAAPTLPLLSLLLSVRQQLNLLLQDRRN